MVVLLVALLVMVVLLVALLVMVVLLVALLIFVVLHSCIAAHCGADCSISGH